MGTAAILDEIWDPITHSLDAATIQRLLDYRASAAIQERVDYLGDRANEGLLTEDERFEYEAIIHAFDTIALLKLRARRLAHPS